MIRIHALAVSSLLCAAACTPGPSPTGPSNDPPGNPGPDRPADPGEPSAATLGMTVLSRDASGAPRLMRSIVPRARPPGMAPQAAARDHLAALAPLWIGHAAPMALTDLGTERLRNGATVARLAQEVDGAVMHQGEVHVLMYADGSLAAVSGTLLPATTRPRFTSSPRQALDRALDRLYGAARARPAITELGDRDSWQQLSVDATPAWKINRARARREIAMVDGTPTPVWAVEVLGGTTPTARDPDATFPAARRYLVRDADGQIVGDFDLLHHDAFVYRAYAEQTGNRRPLDGPFESFAPHPTGVPGTATPAAVSSNLVVMDSFNRSFDPWLPGNATTTSGNNVDAFSDLDASDSFNEGDIRPRVTAGRVLNYRFDPQVEPFGNPEQANAGTVNAFFVANWMHDWWYDSGFTEATGNAQVDNYGRGGIAGDPLVIEAQWGANVGFRDNAFISVPLDGESPRMSVELDNTGSVSSLTTPLGPMHSVAFLRGPLSFDVTAEVVIAEDQFPPTNDGCDFLSNDVTGKIVLAILSDQCTSFQPLFSAKFAGAVGLILVDSTLDPPRMFRSGTGQLPALGISKTDGEALSAAIAAGSVTVALHGEPAGPGRDDDVDNTTIAHEWGHYLHLRLASCETGTQCFGMSEGWADFNALLMMLRDGDNREGTYAVIPYGTAYGTFDSFYFGIRRFPYSIDRTKNALSFRHISDGAELPPGPQGAYRSGNPNSESHATGEVWASMLWEAYNLLIDAHDGATARRRMSDYVVAGLLLTPPEATFTEARDAILAGAGALDSDDMLLMAAAFAGRGAGTCAVSPDRESLDNVGVVESGTLAARIEVGGLGVTDDGASCDHDGYLDPGESGTLRVTVLNAGPVAAEGVAVTTTASLPGIQLGAPISLGTMQPFTSADLAIPVRVPASAPLNTRVVITIRIAGDGGCEKSPISLALPVMIGVDEAEAVSRIDHVETTTTPWTPTGDGADSLWRRVAEPGGNHAWLGKDASITSDTQLVSPVLLASATAPLVVRLTHAYNLDGFDEFLFDAGVIEVSTDGGASWVDVADLGADPGYPGEVITTDNVLFGRRAFGSRSPGFPERRPLVLDFGTRLAGQAVQLRFRIGTDSFIGLSGWSIDEFEVSGTDNTPFPDLVPEPSVCTVRSAARGDSAVLATHAAPSTSLAPLDAACVAAEGLLR